MLPAKRTITPLIPTAPRDLQPRRVAAGVPACRGREAGTNRRQACSWPAPAATGLAHWFFLCLTLAFTPGLPAQESSEPAPLAARSLLLSIVNNGEKLVAVGDHGDVVISRDAGVTWKQCLVPARTLLTGVSFPDSQHGWIVGHDGVILATNDGGITWARQDDGKDLETVYLDVHFRDPLHGLAAGAYGLLRQTEDGGRHWTTIHPGEDEVHYNRLSAGDDGTLYLTGESGTLLQSGNQGATWAKLTVPYDGSLFGTLPLDQGSLLTFGLRGHILRSDDHGATWEPVNSPVRVLIMAGIRRRDGTIVLAGQGGNFFLSHDGGQLFTPWKPADFGTSVADLVETRDGWLVTVGEAGAVRIKLP